MKPKQIIKIIFLSLIFISTKSFSQSIDQKAKAGADFICECSKTALSENGVDTAKLLEIYNSYQSQGTLLSKYKSDVKTISSQMNSNYSAIETEIYKCRSQFRQKFSSDLNNKVFLSKMQDIINKNAYTNGPKLIKDLTN
ncbi:hypothetical protein [Mesoflavibacter sp. CH_XMU1404-2]|uniref:hypothetical protein n=1 Tax=Mesoflavibacter sp. CH_XMU1404-2 TaxID=3107766 RepID=UPI003009397B